MLIKKLFRDICQNFSQFLSIFLMIFLGVFVYVGIGSEIEGMTKNSEKFYKETNMPDLWAYGLFKDNEKVENATTSKKLTMNGNIKNKDNTDLEINFINSDKVSNLYVIDGQGFSYDSDKIWIDSKLASHLKLKPGDEVTIKINKLELKKEIAGLVMSPEHVYAIKDSSQVFPSHDDYGFVYLSSKYYPFGEITYNYLLIDTNKKARVKKELERQSNVIAVYNREANSSYATFKTEIDSHKTYAGIFPIIFLFIALLSVITTLNRMVKNQRMEIGTLKALGFKKQKIILHYTMYGFITSLVAAIMGIVLGPLLLGNYILFLENGYFQLPYLSAILTKMHILVSIGIVLAVALCSYLSVYKELEGSAAETLRPKAPKKIKHTLIAKSPLWHKLSFKTQWNLRDVFRNMMRSFMAIIGVAGCTMLTVCAFGMLNTLDNFISWQYDDIYHFKNQIILENNKDQIINDYKKSTVSILQAEVKGTTTTLTVDDSGDLITYTDHNKKEISVPNNGVMISEKLADKLDLKVGDNITFKIYGMDTLTLKIKKINRAPSTQNITIARSYFETLGYEYNPSIAYTNEEVKSDIGVVSTKEELRENTSKMMGTMSSVIVIIIVVALLLESVVIYNLGVLSYTEKLRELATLKVLGFNDSVVGKVLKQQNCWLTVIGIILGLPLGKELTNIIFSTVMGYSFDIMPVVNISSYVFAAICTFVAMVIVNAILNKKVKKLDMVTSLKGNE